MNREQSSDLYQQWADAFKSIGACHISDDTCCKILAIVYDNGGNEDFTHNNRFITDWKTAQDRLYIHGGTEIPEDRLEKVADLRERLKSYIKELEATYDTNKSLRETLPEWAKEIYNRYGMSIIG